jgi:hypothetical protein
MVKNMVNNKPLSAPLTLVMLLLLSLACLSSTVDDNSPTGGCFPLPEEFTEMDLVGTWWAGFVSSPQVSDTLIIWEDGTYKQVIQLEYPPAEYESDWQAWWFEYRDNGTGYLHLDDFRTCAVHARDFEESCDLANDGERPWADLCEQQWMDPGPRAGEMILVVHGTPSYPGDNRSHPFVFTIFRGFEHSPWTYGFVEP